MTKYIVGEIFSSGRATLYTNLSDQSVMVELNSFVDLTEFFFIKMITYSADVVFFPKLG